MKKRKILKIYTWLDNSIYLNDIVELSKDCNQKDVVIELVYEGDYDENPHLELVYYI